MAISLHNEGLSYEDVADELGFAGRGSAWKAVDHGLRAERDERANDYLQTQVDRYEAILAAWWEKATRGHDAKAALVGLRALERLDKVLGLGHGEHSSPQETMVISADPEAYVRQLQQVVEEREQRERATR